MTQEAKIILAISVVTLVLIIGGAFFFSSSNKKQEALNNAPVDQKLLTNENSHKISAPDSKVTIVEFGDYQCPACASAYPIVKQLLKEYDGKINFVFRNFPLSLHPNAQKAAQAAEAAAAQGKFWEMHDKLYVNQTNWSGEGDPQEIFIGYAGDLGLDKEVFKKDINDNKYTGVINTDASDGDKLGVDSTPTFFLNGSKITGVPTYSDLKAQVDKNLQ